MGVIARSRAGDGFEVAAQELAGAGSRLPAHLLRIEIEVVSRL